MRRGRVAKKERRERAEERAEARAERGDVRQLTHLIKTGHSHCKEVKRLRVKLEKRRKL